MTAPQRGRHRASRQRWQPHRPSWLGLRWPRLDIQQPTRSHRPAAVTRVDPTTLRTLTATEAAGWHTRRGDQTNAAIAAVQPKQRTGGTT